MACEDEPTPSLPRCASGWTSLGMQPVVSSGLHDGRIGRAAPLGTAALGAHDHPPRADAGPLRRSQCRGARNGTSSSANRAREAWRSMRRARLRQGVTLAIENHQDFTSRELVAFCEEAGANVGIIFDTGNTFPVAEAPLDFTRVIAPHVRHVHLKDYRVQFTDEGYRLVRCAIGDGAVPFPEMLGDARRAPRRADRGARAGRARGAARAPLHARLVERLSRRRRADALAACLHRRAGEPAAGGCRLPHALGARTTTARSKPTSST